MEHEAERAPTRHMSSELPLLFVAGTASLFVLLGDRWLADLSNPFWLMLMFAWLFLTTLWAALAAVRHADALAILLGEPYGTLVLTLSVICVEVSMISAVMLHGRNNPTMARDAMFAVIMIVLNGMVGLALLAGGWRHREQHYNLQGANSYLAVLIPLAVLSLVLPSGEEVSPIGATVMAVEANEAVSGLYAVFPVDDPASGDYVLSYTERFGNGSVEIPLTLP